MTSPRPQLPLRVRPHDPFSRPGDDRYMWPAARTGTPGSKIAESFSGIHGLAMYSVSAYSSFHQSAQAARNPGFVKSVSFGPYMQLATMALVGRIVATVSLFGGYVPSGGDNRTRFATASRIRRGGPSTSIACARLDPVCAFANYPTDLGRARSVPNRQPCSGPPY